jgi:hypothetical protein
LHMSIPLIHAIYKPWNSMWIGRCFCWFVCHLNKLEIPQICLLICSYMTIPSRTINLWLIHPDQVMLAKMRCHVTPMSTSNMSCSFMETLPMSSSFGQGQPTPTL